MADNVTFKDASGATQTHASDDIAGVHYPRVKLTWGADGAANDTQATSPLPARDPALGTVAHNRVTVTTAGTRVQFQAQASEIVMVKALRANASTVYIGGSAVTTANGFPLDPGDTAWFPISNANLLWADADASGDSVAWIAGA